MSYGIWEETPGESQGLNEIFSSLRGSLLTRIYAGCCCVVVDSCCYCCYCENMDCQQNVMIHVMRRASAYAHHAHCPASLNNFQENAFLDQVK